MKHLLYWLSSFLPCRIISDDGTPYLERYYIGTWFGVRFYLHRFVGSAPARGLHDHPWAWARSFILSGWYYEERLSGAREVRWQNSLKGSTFHRVILPASLDRKDDKPQPCWTLFWHDAAYTKPWGFIKRGRWWPHDHAKGGNGNGTPEALWKHVPNGKFEVRRAKP